MNDRSVAPVYALINDTDDEFIARLTDGQRAQLHAALTYHALLNPGSVITVVVAIGDPSQVPALTDHTSLSETAVVDLHPQYEIRARSTALGPQGATEVRRAIRLGHSQASPATTRPPAQQSLPRRVYRALEQRGPVILDTVREFIMRRREREIASQLTPFPHGQQDVDVSAAFNGWARVPAPAPAAPAAVLFGLHWLQTGGAERWAIESIQIAKDAGFLPVIVTDQNSVHPWLTRPELQDCVVITLSFDDHEHPIDVALTHALLENFNFSGVVLHHSYFLYQMLPWIKQHRPDLPVVDSLHIVEYLGGGYPGLAVRFDEFIDVHHVISPQLVEWLTHVQNVERDKLTLAPLTALTVDQIGGFARRASDAPFTIAFVGRLSRQKRPDVFLGLVHELRKRKLRFRAILHGDGEMREIVDGLLDRFDLADLIEQRFEDTPVADTLAESDVLVVTSINEGLTLTTFEAVAAGIPVISTDVGSQRTIVQGEALLPRPARRFIGGAAALIERLAENEELRERLWASQRAEVTDFSALPSAHHFMKELFASWQA